MDGSDSKMLHKSLVFANIAENCLKKIASFIYKGKEV